MSRLRFRLMLILATVALFLAGAGSFFTYQVQQVPEFYEQAIAAQPKQQMEAGQQFEQEALEVQNQIRRAGEWRAEIAADEINDAISAASPRTGNTLARTIVASNSRTKRSAKIRASMQGALAADNTYCNSSDVALQRNLGYGRGEIGRLRSPHSQKAR